MNFAFTTRPRAHRLTNLRINRVDLVDRGANLDPDSGDGAHILLAKRAEPNVSTATAPNATAAILTAAGSGGADAIIKAANGNPAEYAAHRAATLYGPNAVGAGVERERKRDALWREITDRAELLMSRTPTLTREQAIADVVLATPRLYADWLAA